MTDVYKDRVLETTTTTGTGTLTLAGAVAQYQAFAVIGVGNTCRYTLLDANGVAWEVGDGTVGAGTLSRDTVLDGSSGPGVKINLTNSGVHQVFNTPDATQFPSSGVPAGADTQVQFNDGGVFGADSRFTFDKVTGNFSVTTAFIGSEVLGDPTTAHAFFDASGFASYADGAQTTLSNLNWESNDVSMYVGPLAANPVLALYVTSAGVVRIGNPSLFTGSLAFCNSSNSNLTSFQAGVAAASVTYTLPTNDGAASSVLATNGSGTLSWAVPASGTVTDVSVVSANGFSGSVATSTTTPAITLTMQDAAADGSTKGIATYTANDFSTASGVVSLDYANGQKASASVPGFLSSTDWSTFNAKANATTQITGFFDGGGSAVALNSTSICFPCTFAGTIVAWTITVDTGTCTIKTWKKATGTAIPTSSDSISSSGVSIASGTAVRSTTVTDFTTTTISANDLFIFTVTAVSAATKISFTLEVTKT